MIFNRQSNKLLLIAGPCSLESESLAMKVAEKVKDLSIKYSDSLEVIFKGSFDKANRTSINSPRGTGLNEGLRIFQKIKDNLEMRVLTDVHEAHQCQEVAQVCDVLQIPAFLCRQTDLLVSAAKTKKVVNVKKGQFVSPYDMKYVVGKLNEANAVEIWQTERGSTFGYGNLVVDMRALDIMAKNNTPVIFDATHSVQLPSAGNGISSGQREYVGLLSKAAIASGADGLFIETHPEPTKAMSDSATQLKLDELETLIQTCLRIKQVL